MKKLDNLKIRGISLLTAAFTIVSLSGCKKVTQQLVETTTICIEETNNDKYEETIPVEITTYTEETIPAEITTYTEETIPAEITTYTEETIPAEITTYTEETIPTEITTYTEETIPNLEETIPEDYPEEFTYISQEGNEFNEYCKTATIKGEEVLLYRGYNVILAIDEKTYEVKEYIYNKGAVTDKVYDLATGYMIVDGSLISFPSDIEVSNWDKIKKGNHIFDFAYIDSYLENPEYKEWYTIEEIKELELVIIDVIKTLLNDNSKVK